MSALPPISRRHLLKTGGVMVVGFALGAARPLRLLGQAGTAAARVGKDATEVDSFLAIHADGSVTLFTSKVDVGTGLKTAFCQVAAEELGISADRFTVVEGDTELTPDHGGTGGSSGVPRGAADLRRAAATARHAILNLAAARLNQPAAALMIADGQVRGNAGGPVVTIASLIGDTRLSVKLDPTAPLKNPSSYTVVGQPRLRADVPDKCTGRHTYVQDLSVPGMVHGRVIRPPARGAKLVSVDEASLRGIPDVRVVRIDNFLGVVAKDEWTAVTAARTLKAAWNEWEGLPGSEGFDRVIREAVIVRDQSVVSRGDVESALSAAAQQFSATYYWPFQSHASLGPSCAIADVRESATTVWTSSQNVFPLRRALARTFGLPQDTLRVIFLDGSGSYGTNGSDDAAADAVLLSKAVGQPVRVQWSREDELGWDPKGPAQLLQIRGGLDAQGRIAAWESQMWLPSDPGGDRALIGAEASGLSQTHGLGTGVMTQHGDPPYAVDHVRVTAHLMKDTPLKLSNLRAPGKIANVFAVESFIDEMASGAGVDPVAFRLRGLTDAHAIEVIQRATQMIGWQARPSPNPRAAQGAPLVGRGMAYIRYKQAENYIAIAMEVAVDRPTGKISVRRVTCAHDCGLIINPDGLRNQIEGSIMQTLSRALHEEITFDRSRVTSVDWASYPLLRFPDVPTIDVALINRPDQPALGAGEASSVPVAAALANAIFDATGVRLRRAPLTSERMKAALTAP
jgi:nicotinate dehydrogenase subunit B